MEDKGKMKGMGISSRPVSKKRTKVDSVRWPGVYVYELETSYQGRSDVVYTVTYKRPADGRKIWEKVGKRSEGITPQLAAEIRAERMKTARHGGTVKTSVEIQRDALLHDRLLSEIADRYFVASEGFLKGIKTDQNRWEKHLRPLFGDRRVSSLSELDVQRVKAALKEKAPATVWNSLELLRRLVNWGARHNYCQPLKFKIKMPRRDNEVVEYLTDEQAAQLSSVLASWPSQDVARMLRVALVTGLRRGEIFALEDGDVDWKHGLIKLLGPKGGRSVTIPLSMPVAAIFREQIDWRNQRFPASKHIFPGRGGNKRVDCGAVDRIKKEAGLPVRFRIFHGLRHHFAVTLANSGRVDLSMIGALLTHKSEAMTRRYAQYLPETTRKVSELAAVLLQDSVDRGGQSLSKTDIDNGSVVKKERR